MNDASSERNRPSIALALRCEAELIEQGPSSGAIERRWTQLSVQLQSFSASGVSAPSAGAAVPSDSEPAPSEHPRRLPPPARL